MENQIFKKVLQEINGLSPNTISSQRKEELLKLALYFQSILKVKKTLNVIFICTHNSRRSQLAQVWAQFFSQYNQLPIQCFSGGTEITRVHPMVIETLKNQGFLVKSETGNNPKIEVQVCTIWPTTMCFSKYFDHKSNPQKDFVAVMTCSNADENCPFIPDALSREKLMYKDPGSSDGTNEARQVYLNCSRTIATEMKFLFEQIR